MRPLLFIPARGGSVTIPLKNMHLLGGFSLIHWVLRACKPLTEECDIIVSTDHPRIREYCQERGFAVDERPAHLEDGAISVVVTDYLARHRLTYDIIILVQPTSPFVTVEDIHSTIQGLKLDKFMSAQTICEVPHNYHAWNQRTFSRSEHQVGWYEPNMRSATNRKQGKPLLFKFGNCVAVRGDPTILPRHGFFALPSRGIEIPWKRAIDVDNLDDFDLAESLIESGRI